MLTPVGGVDRIATALAAKVARRIRYQTEVREIRRTAAGGVRIAYVDHAGGRETWREATGDLCICTIPPKVLTGIPADFAPDVAAGLLAVEGDFAFKAGLQFKRRFWEEDDGIYGGISRTADPIAQIIYPSEGFHSAKGVLVGAYSLERDAVAFGELSLAERQERVLAQGAKLHGQYAAEFESGFSVAWQRVPWSLGAWGFWTPESHKKYYPLLNEPDGPFHFAGEHLTYLGGWMAGAFTSAQKVCADVHRRARA
jgi:monoamine oxidase